MWRHDGYRPNTRPWRRMSSYDRPIPRRIVEEAGLPHIGRHLYRAIYCLAMNDQARRYQDDV